MTANRLREAKGGRFSEIFGKVRKAAKSVEAEYGRKNLGPYDDFEWGMLNGKLSAQRWVMGDEWDMLDT
jgi:hypothetical protein